MLATRTHGGLFRHPFFRFDPVFDAILREAVATPSSTGRSVFTDEGDTYVLRVHAPGIAKDAFTLTLEADVLTLVAERAVQVPEGYEAVHRERKSWRLERSVALPADADPETVTAAADDGVLTVTVGKTPAPVARQIHIA